MSKEESVPPLQSLMCCLQHNKSKRHTSNPKIITVQMCALLLPGNISPLRSQIVLPSVLSVSSVLILLKKSSQQTIKTLDLTLHHSSSPLDSWYPFSQIWYYELETVLVSSCEIKNTHSVWKSQKKSHSTLRATLTFYVDKSAKNGHFCEFLKIWSLWPVLPDRSYLVGQKQKFKCESQILSENSIFRKDSY